MIYIVYKLTRNDGQIYIGTTNRKRFKNRMNSHKYSNRFKNNTFDIDIIEENNSYEYIQNREEYYIKQYSAFDNGLNESINGKGNHLSKRFTTRGFKFSEESRRKMSNAKKGIIPWNKGMKNCFSKETIEKISNSCKGRIRTPTKLKENQVKNILEEYNNKIFINNSCIDKIMRNGRKLTYERAFAKEYSKRYNVTNQCIYNLIKRRAWKNV